MKKVFVLLAFVATVALTSCGGGKPDLDDPKAVASYMCDKTKEMMELAKDLEGNAGKIEAMEKEIEAFEEEIEQHHKDGEKAFEEKVQAAFKDVCDINLGM